MKKTNRVRQFLLLIFAIIILLSIFLFINFIGYQKKTVPKIGLIITGSCEEKGWNGAHYQGVKYACEQMGAELLVKEYILEGSGDCEKAVRELVAEGAGMIILSSYAYPEELRNVVTEYPDIAFYGISAEHYAENMTSFFGRMYQARYLAGMIAGMKTENGLVGYVAAMPNIEVNRGINAFTLGVKRTNPNAIVHVVWTDTWDDENKEIIATRKLIDEVGVDLITYHQNKNYVAQKADAAGIYSIGYNEETEGLSEKYLTATVWNWNELYYQILKEYIQGNANSEKRYWYGIDTDVVMLSEYSAAIDEEISKVVENAKNELTGGKDVFSGVIFDNTGQLRCNEGESISDDVLLEKMNWYVDGVIIYE
ncbi:MAG: BMP family ABC transporter substrate-binding protein [Lachnospiraceae bacterium]|nr:BMP family ABC transporter substrate-binding protein [Lachnospiraceae bacterium]